MSLEYEIKVMALEKVYSMPKQGVKGVFSFGMNFGVWQGILAALGTPYFLPGPRDWQKGLIPASDGPDPKARIVLKYSLNRAQGASIQFLNPEHSQNYKALIAGQFTVFCKMEHCQT